MSRKQWDLMTRKKLTLAYAKHYQRAPSKRKKSQILAEFTKLTGYNRSYAPWLLRHAGRRITIHTPQGPQGHPCGRSPPQDQTQTPQNL